MNDFLDLQLSSFERRLRELETDLAELRRTSAASVITVSPVVAPAPKPIATIDEANVASWLRERLDLVRERVTNGELKNALKLLDSSRARALSYGEVEGLLAILRLTESIGQDAPPSLRHHADRLAYATRQNIRFADRKRAARGETAEPPPVGRPARAPRAPKPPREPLLTLPKLGLPKINTADLLGAGALAVAGGVVTLLGIVFFFVLAVNRGWIGPLGRVGLGSAASLTIFGAGFELRRRYKDTHASLAAVGVGIAGGFVTLLAAALYHLLPDYAALVICASIACVALVTALAWKSQMVGGFGLIGAMLVPVAVVAQSGLSVLGTSFVAIVLAATAIVSVQRRWRELLVAGSAVSLPQITVLAAQAQYHGQAPARIVVLVAVFALLYLAAGIAYQLRVEGAAPQQISTSLITSGGLLAAAAAVRLFGDKTDEGVALLVVTLAYAVAAGALFARRAARDLSAYLAAIALTLVAIGLAYLLSGQPLAYTWAAEAAALAWLARRLREPRYQVWSAAYLLLTLGHVLILDAPPTQLLIVNEHAAAGAATAVALALATAVFAFYARPWTERIESNGGLFGLLAPALAKFQDAHRILRSAALWTGGVLVTYAAALGLLGLFSDFGWGHVAVAALWSIAGLGILLAGLRLDLAECTLGGLAWLATSSCIVVIHGDRSLETAPRSWAYLVVAVALVAGSLAHQLLHRKPTGTSMDISAGLAAAGIGLGAVAGAGILSGQPLAFTWALEAAALAWLAHRTRAAHLQVLSIATLGLALAHVLRFDAPPADYLTATANPAYGALAAVAVAVVAGVLALQTPEATGKLDRYLALSDLEAWLAVARKPIREAELWLAGVVATYAISLATLAIVPSFGWGHVVTTGLWSAIGLAVTLVGLRRGSTRVSNGGVIWLGATTAALVAHGQLELASTPRSSSFLILAAALLAAGHAYQLLRRNQAITLDPIAAVFVFASLALSIDAIAVLRGNSGGGALLGVAAIYAALSATVFRRTAQRDYRTVLWGIAVAVGSVAADRLLDGTLLVLAWAATGATVAWLGSRTAEPRFQIGASAVTGLALGHAIVIQSPPSHLFSARENPGSGALAVLIVAVAIAIVAYLVAGDHPLVRRARLAAWWLAGVLAVYGVSLEILDLMQRAFPQASLQTNFQRGHTTVSAFWGLLGLALLYAGLKRWRVLRIAGFAVLATSLAKIFLYDLPSLNSITRALSFLAVGAVLLLGGFFYQRLSASEKPQQAVPEDLA